MAKRTYRKPPPAQPPADAEAGAALIRAYAVKLFDRHDGDGADWPLMTASLFKAAFEALDKLPDDRRAIVARRVGEGAYNRLAGFRADDPAASKAGPAGAESAPSNTDFESTQSPTQR
jgi:hypothetical protein